MQKGIPHMSFPTATSRIVPVFQPPETHHQSKTHPPSPSDDRQSTVSFARLVSISQPTEHKSQPFPLRELSTFDHPIPALGENNAGRAENLQIRMRRVATAQSPIPFSRTKDPRAEFIPHIDFRIAITSTIMSIFVRKLFLFSHPKSVASRQRATFIILRPRPKTKMRNVDHTTQTAAIVFHQFHCNRIGR